MTISSYQLRVAHWMLQCFGAAIAADMVERIFRFFEESAELAQALDMTEAEAMEVVRYVYSREKGEPRQEVGGVAVTLAALCNAGDIGMMDEAERELNRVWEPQVMAKIRAKQAAKPQNVRSALPGDPHG